MKNLWIYLLIGAVVVAAVLVYRKKQQDETNRQSFVGENDLAFMSPAIDNGSIIPDDFEASWTVS